MSKEKVYIFDIYFQYCNLFVDGYIYIYIYIYNLYTYTGEKIMFMVLEVVHIHCR